MACVYIDCNVQSGYIFRVTVKLMKLTATRAAGAKRPLITKMPTTPENPINVIKGSVREIRKDGPRGRHPTLADVKQMSRGCEGRDMQEEGQPVRDTERQEREQNETEGRTKKVTEAEDESSAGLEVIQPRKSERETSTNRNRNRNLKISKALLKS